MHKREREGDGEKDISYLREWEKDNRHSSERERKREGRKKGIRMTISIREKGMKREKNNRH
jgi:hypothetical protein